MTLFKNFNKRFSAFRNPLRGGAKAFRILIVASVLSSCLFVGDAISGPSRAVREENARIAAEARRKAGGGQGGQGSGQGGQGGGQGGQGSGQPAADARVGVTQNGELAHTGADGEWYYDSNNEVVPHSDPVKVELKKSDLAGTDNGGQGSGQGGAQPATDIKAEPKVESNGTNNGGSRTDGKSKPGTTAKKTTPTGTSEQSGKGTPSASQAQQQLANAREAVKNTDAINQIGKMKETQIAARYGSGVARAIKTDGVNATAALAAQNAASKTAYEGISSAAAKGAQNAVTSDMIAQAKATLAAQGNTAPSPEQIATEIMKNQEHSAAINQAASAEVSKQAGAIKADSAAAAKAEAGRLDSQHSLSDGSANEMADTAYNGNQKAATEEGVKKGVEEKVEKEEKDIKFLENNYGQYALLVLESIAQNKIGDATKKVKVKAEEMQDSQGEQSEETATETAIAATAKTLMDTLKEATIDMSLISTDIAKEKTSTMKAGVKASAGKSGSGVSATSQTVVTQTSATIATEEERELRRRRALLVGEWATAAAQIGEASNAISKNFYDRAAAFAEAANDAEGSLGGITAISDTDRFVLFEITRGAALSSMSLGLQGSVNLNDMSDIVLTSTTTQ